MVTTTAREQVDTYLESHRAAFEDQLHALLRIPSVSAQPDHNADTRRAAEFLIDDFRGMGLDVELVETAGHPIVYAESLRAPGKPTLLVYGHYDVQPPEPLEPWDSPPFEPIVRDGNIVARGATDDKGQMLTHLKAAEAWIQGAGSLPINLKFLIEGEEEVGSRNLETFLDQNRARLACDYAVISDTSQYAPEMPAITYGLRGLAYFEVTVHGPQQDLHSGLYGGAVGNPAAALARILAGLHNDRGRITLPEFYDSVVPLQDWERDQFAALPFDEDEYKRYLGVDALVGGESDYRPLERVWARPTCDINGLTSGYQGPGPKTVLPRMASAKVSFRLVPDQTPERVADQFRRHLDQQIPPGFRYELVEHHGAPATLVRVDSPGVQAAIRAIESGFGTKPVFVRGGGSIPVVGQIKEYLGVDTLLLGWGQEDDNLHGPNEKFSLRDFHRGIKASAHLMAELNS